MENILTIVGEMEGLCMAEFCPECLTRLNGTERAPLSYVLSRELDLCEGCGQWKRVVIRERNMVFLQKTGLGFLAAYCSLKEKKRTKKTRKQD